MCDVDELLDISAAELKEEEGKAFPLLNPKDTI